jgi:hypothetical protein
MSDINVQTYGAPTQYDIIPEGMRVSSRKPVGVKSKMTVQQFNSVDGTYDSISKKKIQIRVASQNGFLNGADTLLHFKFTNSSTDKGVIIDGGASSIIENFRIMNPNNSIKIEDIPNYNRLRTILNDFKLQDEYLNSTGAITEGLGYDIANQPICSFSATDSMMCSDAGTEPIIFPTDSRTFNIKLVSGLLNCGKYIPLPLMKGLVFEFDLADTGKALLECTLTTPVAITTQYTISEVYLTTSIIEFPDEVINSYISQARSRGGVNLDISTWICNNLTMIAHTSFEFDLGIKAHSIRSLLFGMYDTTKNTTQYRSLTRLYNNISQYQFKIGSRKFPDNPIDIRPRPVCSTKIATAIGSVYTSEAYCELLKCFGTLNDIKNTTYLVDPASYTRNATAVFLPNGKFLIGCDLETYNEDSSLIRCGYDNATPNEDIKLNLKASATTTACDCAVFAMVDAVVNIIPDGVSGATQNVVTLL